MNFWLRNLGSGMLVALAVAVSGCATMSEVLDELAEAASAETASPARSQSVAPGGGQLIPTAALDPATLRTLNWYNRAAGANAGLGLDGRLDQEFAFNCPAGGALTWNVYGTDIYTTASSVCVAAVHARRITARDGGVVIIRILRGQATYTGSERGGVSSRNSNGTQWGFEFISDFTESTTERIQGGPTGEATGVTAVASLLSTAETDPSLTRLAPWGRSISNLGVARNLGQDFAYFCPPGGALGARVFGDAVYHPDSSLCDAAVQEGRITARDGGHVIVTIESGLASYRAANRNGVASLAGRQAATSFRFIDRSPDLGPIPHAFEIVEAATSSATTIPNGRWNMALSEISGAAGEVFRVTCPPGGQIGSVVGAGFYHPGSSLCTAAVHAGLISPRDGGGVGVQVLPARGYFLGAAANGITSTDGGHAARSFRLIPLRPM